MQLDSRQLWGSDKQNMKDQTADRQMTNKKGTTNKATVVEDIVAACSHS